MRAEVEAKFVADDPSVLAGLAGAPSLAFAVLGPARTVPESDRYLDTADGLLSAARWACRLRNRGGEVTVSLKGPAESVANAWHHRRPEVEGPATDSLEPADWPHSEARDWLVELSGGAPLEERVSLRQLRTERAVLVEDRAVATLSLDVVDVIAVAGERGRVCVVELELASGDSLPAGGFEALADALSTYPGLRADPSSKLEHALHQLAAR
jgi:inorganic triphosphatase YgiF